MISELQTVLEEAYLVFSVYGVPKKGNGCPCCVSDSDEFNLHAADLRELSAENLARYAFKAMTTWGGVEDFKYYLPRMMELLLEEEDVCDEGVFLGKFSYGRFNEWPLQEQQVVSRIVTLWWKEIINKRQGFSAITFIDFYSFIGDFQSLTDLWELEFDSQGFRNYVDFIYSHANEIVLENKLGTLKLTESEKKVIENFVFLHAEKLHQAWLYLEKADPDFAADIALAYDTISVLKKFR